MSFLRRSQHPTRVGECRIIKLKSSHSIPPNTILEKYSEFCQGKTIGSIKSLGQGSYGVVFEVEIDGVKFALKTQIVNTGDSFESMEKEVSLTNSLSDVRRSDGQRISIPVFDCFFLCEKFKNDACKGEMFYIMEKGNNNLSNLIKRKRTIELAQDLGSYKVLLRDSTVKMMENIYLFVSNTNKVNIDTKPGNCVYNFKMMEDTREVQINPIFIDLDNDFCLDIEEIVDYDVLNKILMNYMINDKPLKSTPLTQEEKVQFFSLVFQISYLNLTFEKVLEHRDSFEILRDVFTSPKKRNEMVSLIELVEMLTKSTLENCWLSACFQLLLETNFIDKVGTVNPSQFRKSFYNYNYNGRRSNSKEKKYFTFLNYLSRYYKFCFEPENAPELQLLKLNYDYVEAILNDEVESTEPERETKSEKPSVKVLNSGKSVRSTVL